MRRASRGLEKGLKGASRGLEKGFNGASRGRGLQGGLKGASEGLQGLEKGFEGGFKVKRASRQLGGGFRRASEGERFEGGLSKVRKVLEKGLKRLEKFLRRLRRLITCASNRSLAPPILTCTPQPTHLRPPPCLPQCHDLNSKFLFKLPLPLAFHNAMI